MTDIREHLAHKPLLFDGGMGTYYKAAPGADCEMANLTDPEGVKKVHAEYLAAGAQAIKTNTFGLPRMAAAQMPGWEELAEAGWKLACDAAAEKDAAVFADLGPAPDTEAAPASSAYGLVVQQFAALGAKNFLFETLSSDVGIVEAVKALRVAVPDAFVMVSFAVLPDGYTREGLLFRDLLRRMEQSGVVDAVGLNCVSAPGAMKKLVQSLGETLLPLSVMPNAGYPVVTRARVLYQGKPEYFAREMGQIAAAGVRILGGCCGTTPAHIAALRAELDALPQQTEAAPAAKLSTGTAPAVEKDDAFLRKLNAGEKVIAIELDSPRVADLSGYLDGARRLQAAGADLLTIADCPIAQARMDSSLVACRGHRELGRQTVALAHPPSVLSFSNIGGKFEGQGPLADFFDEISNDSFFGEKTWEKAESAMQKTVLQRALEKAELTPEDLDYILAGDLLNQCIGSSFGLRDFRVPFYGLYGACSTMGESLSLASLLIDGGYADRAAALTSSHFCTAERQYRMPVPYGSQRSPTAQWTATAAGCTLLSAQGPGPYITHVTCGKIVDQGITDPNNMGAAMAPAAYDTLRAYFADTHTGPADYDAIFTGDLGELGHEIVMDLFQQDSVDMTRNYEDCGMLLYDRDRQDMHAGGSGCGCSAAVFNGYLLTGLKQGRWRRILFAPTGALLSPTSSFQGESIPGICHLVCVSTER